MDVCDENTTQPSILSPELIQELGGGSEESLICAKKQKRKNKQDNSQPSAELIEEVTRQSKRSKKRHIQQQRRLEKEERRGEFIEQLQKYEITATERGLMRSTREIGQTDTSKQRLAKIYKKHKAGLTLTEEEYEELFPGQDRTPQDYNETFIASQTLSNVSQSIYPREVINSENKSNVQEAMDIANDSKGSETVLDIFAIMDEPKTVGKQIAKPQTNTKQYKADQPSKSITERTLDKQPQASIGSSLLQQLKMLKNKATNSSSSAAVSLEPTTHNTEEVEINQNSLLNQSQAPYIPVPVEIPVENYTSVVKYTAADNPTKPISSLPARYIQVRRNPSIQEKRICLPVCGMEQEIVEAIMDHDVVVLCGETGSGKSTQVPQFLYEYGFGNDGMIGITQPRRVAAVSTAERVAVELNQPISSHHRISTDSQLDGLVGYQIRFDSSTITSNTKIKFMTDGILLREVASDLLLKQYRVIILDEAHERNINTDILLGMISRSIKLRKSQYEEELSVWKNLSEEERMEYQSPLPPLKLVIMSATLRVEDFCNVTLFNPLPPVIRVEARQFPVATHFSKRTELEGYLHEVYKKVVQIHRKLPDGGVLVFLTGKMEVLNMCRKLDKALNKKSKHQLQLSKSSSEDEEGELGLFAGLDAEGDDRGGDDFDSDDDSIENYSDNDSDSDNDENIEEGNEVVDEASKLRAEMLREALGIPSVIAQEDTQDVSEDKGPAPPSKALILPLFAMMPHSQQQLVFNPPPLGHRLIVVATNVAETSITIPDIKYVVDCGRQKERVLNLTTGISKYEVRWISKASAEQRKGRAGRTGAGHCYRLYSSAFFDQHMSLFKPPEILATPLEDLLLQMRAMGISDVEAFPFPTPPPRSSLTKALQLLVNLGSIILPNYKTTSILDADIDDNDKKTAKQLLRQRGAITDLGKLLAKFPINPRFAKILVMGDKAGILQYAIALVSILADKSPFSTTLASIKMQNDKEDDDDGEEDKLDSDEDYDENKDEEKKRAERIKALRYHEKGDALARLRAFGAFTYYIPSSSGDGKIKDPAIIKNIEKFCNEFSLSQSILMKAAELQCQLRRICSSVLGVSTSNEPLPPPSSSQETKLLKLLLASFPDSVARKIVISQQSMQLSTQLSRRQRLTAYQSSDNNVSELLYLHPMSSLYQRDPSAVHSTYLVYTSLIKNEKDTTVYMDNASVIHPQWIGDVLEDCPLLSWSVPLESPAPSYDSDRDEVMCWAVPKYGPSAKRWEFSPVKRSVDDCVKASYTDLNISEGESIGLGYRKVDLGYRWFARALLEGNVFPEIANALNKKTLSQSAADITDRKPLAKVSSLLLLLVNNKIRTRAKLVKKLKTLPTFLMVEIQAFLAVENRKAFRQAWTSFAQSL